MRWMLTLVVVGLISTTGIYGSWLYVRSTARDAFEADILKVKQSFYEGVKAADSSVLSIESFNEALGDVDQARFGQFTAAMMSKAPFIATVAYYRHVTGSERATYEASLQLRKVAESISETSQGAAHGIIPAGQRGEYFVVDAVDAAAREQSYFGWDALSDPTKEQVLRAVAQEQTVRASPTFLLDNGNVAFEVFAPVKAPSGQSLQVQGLVGVTIDVTKLLGEQRWREGVTVFLTTILAGDTLPKDIYRSVDRDPARWPDLGRLTSAIEVDRFGQKFGLKFEKSLFPGRVNLSIVAIAAAGALLLAVLAIYLLITYERLQVTLAGLAEANATLEGKVLERTKELALAHAEIKEILDNLDEVVLTIDGDNKIGPVYSPASTRLLERAEITGLDLRDVLFAAIDRHDQDASRHFFALELLKTYDEFQWSLSKDELLKLVKFRVPGAPEGSYRLFSLRYSPIFSSDVFQKMIVVASDVTEMFALRESLAAKEKASSIKEAILGELAAADKLQLKSFFAEADERLRGIQAFQEHPSSAELLPALRTLHTFKGGGRSVGLTAFARLVHEVEDALEPLRLEVQAQKTPAPEAIAVAIATSGLVDACQLYNEYRRVYGDLFGGQAAASPLILGRIIPFLKAGRNDPNALARWYEDASSEVIVSVADLMSGFRASIQELSDQLGKQVSLESPTWDLYVDPKLKGPLTEAFTHALRNAVDHGVEKPDVRIAKGKTAVGRIWLAQEVRGDNIVVTVADDGGGVHLQFVHDIATKKGLVSRPFAAMQPEDVTELLFLPGFSTKSDISEVSGRGIGLDAVRAALSKHGVTCRMLSESGSGTRFEFVLPRAMVKFTATPAAELRAVA